MELAFQPEDMGGLVEHVVSGGPLFLDPSNKEKIIEGLDKILAAMSTSHMSVGDLLISRIAQLQPNAPAEQLALHDQVYKLHWKLQGEEEAVTITNDAWPPKQRTLVFKDKKDAYASLPSIDFHSEERGGPGLVPLSSVSVDPVVLKKLFQVMDGLRAIVESGMQVYVPRSAILEIASAFVASHHGDEGL